MWAIYVKLFFKNFTNKPFKNVGNITNNASAIFVFWWIQRLCYPFPALRGHRVPLIIIYLIYCNSKKEMIYTLIFVSLSYFNSLVLGLSFAPEHSNNCAPNYSSYEEHKLDEGESAGSKKQAEYSANISCNIKIGHLQLFYQLNVLRFNWLRREFFPN